MPSTIPWSWWMRAARCSAATANRTSRRARATTRSIISRRATRASRYSTRKFAKLGVAICWDQWFPETARAMALMGAEILMFPTAIGSEPHDPSLDSAAHWQRTMQGHAAANVMPLVASNRIGVEEGAHYAMTFYGSSFIASHTGEKIAEADRTQRDRAHRRVRSRRRAPLPASLGPVSRSPPRPLLPVAVARWTRLRSARFPRTWCLST